MSNHRQHCQLAKASEPSTLVTWAGAALAVLAVWCITVLLFSL
jgi:hypothetical protein